LGSWGQIFNVVHWAASESSGVANPKFFWGKMVDFGRETVFCLGHHFSKHKMIRYLKNLGCHGPLITPMSESCAKYDERLVRNMDPFKRLLRNMDPFKRLLRNMDPFKRLLRNMDPFK